MSEADLNLFTDIVAGNEIILYGVCMTAFFYPFMAGKKEQRKSRLKRFLCFLIYMALYFIGMAASVCGWLCMIVVLILLVSASKFLDMDREFTFFLGVIFFCIRNLSVLIMRSISYFLDKYLVQRAEAVENIENVFRFEEQQQVHAIQERMEEVEQFYNGIRQMKHE